MKPLTVQELRNLEVGDWVWVENLEHKEYSVYAKVLQTMSGDNLIVDYVYGKFYSLEQYGTKWIAYKNKEQAECKGEIVELPCAVGDMVYWNNGVRVASYRVDGFADYDDGFGMRLLIGEIQPSLLLVGKDLFFDKTEAERRLAELKGEQI